LTELTAIYLISLTVSTFLSMFEVSILTINPIKLSQLIEKRPYLIFFEKKKDKAATDIMIFNFLWDYGSAMGLSALIAIQFFENPVMIFISSAVTAVGTLYIATLTAKLFASKKPEKVLVSLGRVIIAVYYVMKPLVFIISIPILVLLRGLLVNTDKLSDAELLGVLAMAKRDGLLAPGQYSFIKRVIKLTNQIVQDIIPENQKIESVNINSDILSLKEKIKNGCHKRIVVTKVHNQKPYPVGILLFSDIVKVYVSHLEALVDGHNYECPTIAELMHPCVVTPEVTPADVLIHKLDKGDHIVVATNDEGVMTGILQSDDIIHALTN
jgi:CBS domain containing-hemolysin-like protein